MSNEIRINVDLQKCETERCECGCCHFEQKLILKRINKIQAAQPNDVIMPVKFFACIGCGKPHEFAIIPIPEAFEEEDAPKSNMKLVDKDIPS